MPEEIEMRRSGDGIELRLLSDTGTVHLSQEEAETLALRWMLFVFEAPDSELSSPSLLPSFVVRDPITAWGTVEGGHVSLLLFPASMRPISMVFTNDDQLWALLTRLDQELRIPKHMRFPPE
mgnify:CR=1 FL=1